LYKQSVRVHRTVLEQENPRLPEFKIVKNIFLRYTVNIMTSKERLLAALDRRQPDCLPVTTHHLMRSFLRDFEGGISEQAFFDKIGLDPICWTVVHRPEEGKGAFADPEQGQPGFLEARRVWSDGWEVHEEAVSGGTTPMSRFRIVTPKGELTMTTEANEHTRWVTEHLVKEPEDIELIGEFCPAPLCDVDAVNRTAAAFGDRGLVRGHICGFDVYGQPGCWQDAACLVGIEELILATYDDPDWVHELLRILQRRKLAFAKSLKGAQYDVLELGGGDASSTVISPAIFDTFVAPYDQPIIEAAQAAGQRIVYHTCGGMMPLLERIADMGPNAMETFTPVDMGGDVDLAAAKERIGERVCMIGGFDQFHFFTGCSPEETRAEVRRCFEAAGRGGGYILSPSDHFFEADPELLRAFADEARKCFYPS
jgi:uroporphyrinogen decarboxylase